MKLSVFMKMNHFLNKFDNFYKFEWFLCNKIYNFCKNKFYLSMKLILKIENE